MGKSQPVSHRREFELPHLTIFVQRLKRTPGRWLVVQAVCWLVLCVFYLIGLPWELQLKLQDVQTIFNTFVALIGVFLIYYTIADSMTLVLDYHGSRLGGWYASSLSNWQALAGSLAAAGLMAAVPVVGLLTFVSCIAMDESNSLIAAATLGGDQLSVRSWSSALLIKLPSFALVSAILLLLLRDHWLNRYIPRLLAIAATLATGWMPLIRSNHWGETFTLTVLAYGGSAQPQSATSGIPGADIAFFISCLCLVVYLPLILASLGSFPLLHSPHRTAIALVQTLLLLGFAFYGPFLWLSAQWDYLHMEVINFSLTDESGQKGLHGWLLVATLLFILAVAVSCYAAVKLRYRWRSIPIALGVFLALGMVIGSVGMYDMFRAEMWRMHFPDPAVLDSISRLRILPVFAPVQLFLSSWIPTVSAIDMSGSHFPISYLVTSDLNLAPYVLVLYLAAVPLWWYTAHSMLNAARHPQH